VGSLLDQKIIIHFVSCERTFQMMAFLKSIIIDVGKFYSITMEEQCSLSSAVSYSYENAPKLSDNYFTFNNKNKYAYTNTKISLSLQTNNEINDERLEKINNNHKISKNHFKTEKAYVPSRSNEFKKSTLRNIKIENNNANKEHPNFNKHHFDINSKKIKIHIPLDSLINERYQELEKISTLDFNIFELKKKIGYNNVLPLLGYAILQIFNIIIFC